MYVRFLFCVFLFVYICTFNNLKTKQQWSEDEDSDDDGKRNKKRNDTDSDSSDSSSAPKISKRVKCYLYEI